jgi:hypothetical protein
VTKRISENDMDAAAALRAKTELISDLPQTARDMLRVPPTPTSFCNLDWPVALAMAACDPKRT